MDSQTEPVTIGEFGDKLWPYVEYQMAAAAGLMLGYIDFRFGVAVLASIGLIFFVATFAVALQQ